MPPEQVRYRAFDLTIASEIPLPELDMSEHSESACDADVTICLAYVDGPMPPPEDWRLTRFTAGEAYFAWQTVGRMRVAEGRKIDVDPLSGFDHRLLGLFLLGPVIAALLHQRGTLVLHGSAVEVAPGRAALFVGDNGAGKSTIAAAFLKAGHRVLTDDVIALDVAVRVRPAFPAMKLSRAALDALAPLPVCTLEPFSSEAAKLRLRHRNGYSGGALEVAQIYVLERGESPITVELDLPARLAALMRYSYMPKFGVEPLSGSHSASYFCQCATVANSIPVSLLSVPEGFGALSQVVEAVRADVQK